MTYKEYHPPSTVTSHKLQRKTLAELCLMPSQKHPRFPSVLKAKLYNYLEPPLYQEQTLLEPMAVRLPMPCCRLCMQQPIPIPAKRQFLALALPNVTPQTLTPSTKPQNGSLSFIPRIWLSSSVCFAMV